MPGILHKVYITLLKEVSSPDDIDNMHVTHLATLVDNVSHGHFEKEEAKELRVLVQNSVGTGNKTLSTQIAKTFSPVDL